MSTLPPVPSSIIPKSVSIADLLQARKLVKPPDELPLKLVLEAYDCHGKFWKNSEEIKFVMQKSKFVDGGFRDAHKAACKHPQYPDTWVIKQFKPEQAEKVEGTLNVSLDVHTRKQAQMHCVAKKLAEMVKKKAPPEFGEVFTYDRIYFSTFNDKPVTVEEFVLGSCFEYINNNGDIVETPSDEDFQKEVSEKAFSHFTYHITNTEMMVLLSWILKYFSRRSFRSRHQRSTLLVVDGPYLIHSVK